MKYTIHSINNDIVEVSYFEGKDLIGKKQAIAGCPVQSVESLTAFLETYGTAYAQGLEIEKANEAKIIIPVDVTSLIGKSQEIVVPVEVVPEVAPVEVAEVPAEIVAEVAPEVVEETPAEVTPEVSEVVPEVPTEVTGAVDVATEAEETPTVSE